MRFAHDQHWQAFTLVPPQDGVIEIRALPAVHSGIAQRLKPWQRLAGKPADLYRLRLLAGFHGKCAEPAPKSEAKQKAWK